MKKKRKSKANGHQKLNRNTKPKNISFISQAGKNEDKEQNLD